MVQALANLISAERLRFDRFLLDRGDERLIGPDGPIRIGNKAYRVLDALIANDGRLLTKDTLFQDVWDGTYVSESALTSVIKELRRALGDDSRNPRLIESVYGRGYRWLAETSAAEEDSAPLDMGRRPLNFVHRNDGDMPIPPRPTLTNRPSIAVIPIVELGHPNESWFADAIAEEIIIALSRLRDFFVISSMSSLNRRNLDRSAWEISQELGVRYVLSGSIQRSENKVQIIVRLDDGMENKLVWTDKFNDKIDEIFDLQDRIALAVADQTGTSINDAEVHRAKYRPSRNLRELFWQANLLIRRIEPSSIAGALALAERALELEPDDAWAASIAAVALAFQSLNGWTSDRAGARQRAIEYCEAAIASHTEGDERVLGFCGLALASVGHNLDLASELTDRAIEMNPSNATTLFWGSWIDVTSGNADRAIQRASDSLRLNPFSGIRHLISIPLAIAMILNGQYEAAAEKLRKVVSISPQGDALAGLIIALVQLGQLDEARKFHAKLHEGGGAIGGLALLRNPRHAALVEESLAKAAG